MPAGSLIALIFPSLGHCHLFLVALYGSALTMISYLPASWQDAVEQLGPHAVVEL